MSDHDNKLILVSDLRQLTRLSKTTIYREIRRGAFPKPLRLARNRIAWKQTEVLNWIASLPRGN